MSLTPIRPASRARPWSERVQPWIAAIVSALLQLLMLWLLLAASVPTVSAPQGAAGGSRMRVDLLGQTVPDKQPQPTPPKPKQVKKRRASPPVISTLVKQSDHPLPPDETAPPDDMWMPTHSAPAEQPPSQTPSTATTPPASVQRYRQQWSGHPPGMQDKDVADQDEGSGDSPLASHGNGRNPNASGPSLEVGGYMVYYDLHSETQLRAWKEKGMKEIFLPLPGTRYYMICPVDIALNRGAGECRLLPPDSPELDAIGDAREVINMIQVYHHGDVVWRGPGAYR